MTVHCHLLHWHCDCNLRRSVISSKLGSMRHTMVSAPLALMELFHFMHRLWLILLPFAVLWWNTMLRATCSKYCSWNRSRFRGQISARCLFQVLPKPSPFCGGDDASNPEKEVDLCANLSRPSHDREADISSHQKGISLSYSTRSVILPHFHGHLLPIDGASASIGSSETTFYPSKLSSLHIFCGVKGQQWNQLSLTASQWQACSSMSLLSTEIGRYVDHRLHYPWLVYGYIINCNMPWLMQPGILREINVKDAKCQSGFSQNCLVERDFVRVLCKKFIGGRVSDFLVGNTDMAWLLLQLFRQKKKREFTSSRCLNISNTILRLQSILSASNVLQGSMIDLNTPLQEQQSSTIKVTEQVYKDDAQSSVEPCKGDEVMFSYGADGITGVCVDCMQFDTSYGLEGAASMDFDDDNLQDYDDFYSNQDFDFQGEVGAVMMYDSRNDVLPDMLDGDSDDGLVGYGDAISYESVVFYDVNGVAVNCHDREHDGVYGGGGGARESDELDGRSFVHGGHDVPRCAVDGTGSDAAGSQTTVGGSGDYVDVAVVEDSDDDDDDDGFGGGRRDDDDERAYINVGAEKLDFTDTWWDEDAILVVEQCDKEDSIEQTWLVL